MAHGSPEEMADQERRLKAEKLAENKEAIAKGIAARRKTVQNKNDVNEIAEMLARGVNPIAQPESTSLSDIVDIAGWRNDIQRIVRSSTTNFDMKLDLLAAGFTCKPVTSSDGIEDIAFVKDCKSATAKSLFDNRQHRDLISNWCKLSGETPGFLTRERRAEAAAKKQNQDESQHKLKIRRR
jgi:hypothetical protein